MALKIWIIHNLISFRPFEIWMCSVFEPPLYTCHQFLQYLNTKPFEIMPSFPWIRPRPKCFAQSENLISADLIGIVNVVITETESHIVPRVNFSGQIDSKQGSGFHEHDPVWVEEDWGPGLEDKGSVAQGLEVVVAKIDLKQQYCMGQSDVFRWIIKGQKNLYLAFWFWGSTTCTQLLKYMLPPCQFSLYSSNKIVTLKETNRSSHSDIKKLDHFITCDIIV